MPAVVYGVPDRVGRGRRRWPSASSSTGLPRGSGWPPRPSGAPRSRRARCCATPSARPRTGKKEALLEAKEKAHETRHGGRAPRAGPPPAGGAPRAGAHQEGREAHRAAGAPPSSTRRTCGRASRRSASARRPPRATAARYEQLLADQQQELQRVAGLTTRRGQGDPAAPDRGGRQARRRQPRQAARVGGARDGVARARSRSSPRPSSAARPSTPSRRPSRSSTCRATTSRGGSSAARAGTSARSRSRPAST